MLLGNTSRKILMLTFMKLVSILKRHHKLFFTLVRGLKSPLKKTLLYKERDEKKRKEFTQKIKKIPEHLRVYIDESGINEYLHRDRGRSPYGESVKGESSGKRFSRESFIAGKVQSKIIAPFCYQGTCNTDLFNIWIEKILLPELQEGQVVIMDNAPFHKSEKSRLLIEGAGCKILFLPPYFVETHIQPEGGDGNV